MQRRTRFAGPESGKQHFHSFTEALPAKKKEVKKKDLEIDIFYSGAAQHRRLNSHSVTVTQLIIHRARTSGQVNRTPCPSYPELSGHWKQDCIQASVSSWRSELILRQLAYWQTLYMLCCPDPNNDPEQSKQASQTQAVLLTTPVLHGYCSRSRPSEWNSGLAQSIPTK